MTPDYRLLGAGILFLGLALLGVTLTEPGTQPALATITGLTLAIGAGLLLTRGPHDR